MLGYEPAGTMIWDRFGAGAEDGTWTETVAAVGG